MADLSKRSYEKELLDQDNIPFADIKQNMKELNTVNKYLGGHKITTAAVERLTGNYPGKRDISICEIGCGGGDNLDAIDKFCKKRNIHASFIGIDIKPECINFAREQYPLLGSTWITSDYKKVSFPGHKPDIIFTSLFCHHFTEDELVYQLQWMKANSLIGFFINDLHRHMLAYYSIKWITKLFSRSYLVKNDAPLSVARGFTENEWKDIFRSAGISSFSIEWKWAFRHLIICKNG